MTDNRYDSDDYISLDWVKAVLFQVIKAIFSVFDRFFRLIRRYWLLFVLLFSMGIAVGFALKQVVTYNSDLNMLVKFNNLDRLTYSNIIQSLDDLAKSREYDRLVSELNIKHADAQLITGIKLTKPNRDPYTPEDSLTLKNPMLITVSLKSITAADAVDSAIIGYINNNPYIKKVKDGERAAYQEELDFISSELHKLDSLKTEYNRSINSGKSATIYYNAFNPADIYARSAALMDQRTQIVMWFASQRNAASLVSAIKLETINKNRSLGPVALGALSGLVLSLLISLHREIRGRIRVDDRKEDVPAIK